MSDVYRWCAILRAPVTTTTPDGIAEWPEYGPDGAPRGFASVDQSRLVGFRLDPQQDGLPPLTVHLRAGERVIFTRRRQIAVNASDGSEAGRRTVHLLGFQKTVNGANVKSVAYVFEDGSVLLSSSDQAV